MPYESINKMYSYGIYVSGVSDTMCHWQSMICYLVVVKVSLIHSSPGKYKLYFSLEL